MVSDVRQVTARRGPAPPGRGRRRRVLATGLALAVALLGAVRVRADASVPEYELKAAFLYNFAKFVEWPEESLAGDTALAVCVLGDDPFGGTLERTLAGKTVRDHALVLRRFAKPADVRGCHVLFVNVDPRELTTTLRALEGRGALTVGDADGFAERGGMIGFVTDEQRLRFEVNLDAIERAKLRVSSQMLKLATRVLKSD